MRVEPKPGDDVLYFPLPHSQLRQHDRASPLVGKVVYVQHHDLVNLVVWDQNGSSHPMTSIQLWHVDGDKPETMKPQDDYCILSRSARGADAVPGAPRGRSAGGGTYAGPNDKALQEAQFHREPSVHATNTVGAGTAAKVTEQLNPDIEHARRAGIDDVEQKLGSAPRQEGTT
jgi:hypothetical protein